MLVGIAVAWMVGVLVGAELSADGAVWCGVFSILCASGLALAGASLNARFWRASLVALSFVGGLSLCAPAQPPSLIHGSLELKGEVKDIRFGATSQRILLHNTTATQGDEVLHWPSTCPLWLHYQGDSELQPGDIIEATAKVSGRANFRNHPPSLWWKQASSPYSIRLQQWSVQEHGNRAQRFLQIHRQAVREHLIQRLPDELSGLARALAIGDPAVSVDNRAAFVGAGLAHLLAVSGLHVALVAGAWVRLIRLALSRVETIANPQRVACATGMPAAILYAAFCGGAPSAWRAAVTACIGWGLIVCGRRPTSVKTTAAAVVLLSLISPQITLQPAFLLSIAATSAIVSATFADDRSALSRAASISGRTFLATTPLIWGYFGQASPLALVSNVVLLPIGALLLVPTANACTLGAFFPCIAPTTTTLFSWAARAFLQICGALESLQLNAAWPAPTSIQFASLCVGAALLMVVHSRKTQLVVLVCVTLVALVSELNVRAAAPTIDLLNVTFFDVGQGDSALVRFDDGRTMLVDAGTQFPDAGRRALIPIFERGRIERLDVVVISHPHPDHYGGVLALLDKVDIGELWTTRQAQREDPSGPVATLIRKARARGIEVLYPDSLCAKPHPFGSAMVRIHWPCPGYDPGFHENDNSLVLSVHAKEASVLFSGDIEADAEQVVSSTWHTGAVDVLKVPHHGSRTSSTETWLRRVWPMVAIISNGPANRFGHPHDEVLHRYEAMGTTIFRTDQHGAISMGTDGMSWWAKDWRGDALKVGRDR